MKIISKSKSTVLTCIDHISTPVVGCEATPGRLIVSFSTSTGEDQNSGSPSHAKSANQSSTASLTQQGRALPLSNENARRPVLSAMRYTKYVADYLGPIKSSHDSIRPKTTAEYAISQP